MPSWNLLENQIVLQMLSWGLNDQRWGMLSIRVINESFYKENATALFTLEKKNHGYVGWKKYINNK